MGHGATGCGVATAAHAADVVVCQPHLAPSFKSLVAIAAPLAYTRSLGHLITPLRLSIRSSSAATHALSFGILPTMKGKIVLPWMLGLLVVVLALAAWGAIQPPYARVMVDPFVKTRQRVYLRWRLLLSPARWRGVDLG